MEGEFPVSWITCSEKHSFNSLFYRVLRPCYIPPVSPFYFSTRYPIQPATKSRFIFLFSLLSSSLPILVYFLLPLFTPSRLTTDIIARPNEAIEAPTVNSTIRLSGGSREVHSRIAMTGLGRLSIGLD
ncbi:hypothetical protein GYMLUDRAFT_916949 [Collybiopsis luxurians FD-317 M1]|uniref:Uncharacterized protein n=1 Tax=Collybiopsis luxurians FD-317 M1 TaxID=944289 RepID=A0A0D0BHK7_9AGAR|nr:hypothetical protein GYMLUDRAFT_916949 [Collybiopsis luxurians FD-317 M1]